MSYKPCIETQSPTGSTSLPILIVGDAPGEEDEQSGVPFTGPSGRVLESWLGLLEISRQQLWFDHVFHMRPRKDETLRFFCRKSDPEASTKDMPRYQSKVVVQELVPELRRLRGLIKAINPKAIVAVGGCATWAMTGENLKITEVAGKTVAGQFLGEGFTVIPIVHPSYFLRTGHARYRSLCIEGLKHAHRLALTP